MTTLTLEEAIKHCEEVAERKQQEGFFRNTRANTSTVEGSKCYECAQEHRQLAAWLKKLQAYEEARKEIIRKRDSGQWSEAVVYGLNHAIYIIDKHLREVNTDEDSD